MGWTRHAYRRIRFSDTWDELIAGYNGGAGPDIWFRFEDASGGFDNSGSDTTAITAGGMDDTLNTGAQYAEVGWTGGNSAAVLSTKGDVAIAGTAAAERIAAVNASAPAASGTFIIVCRVPMNSSQQVGVTDWFMGDGPSNEFFGMRMNLDRTRHELQLWHRVRRDTTNYYDRHWYQSTVDVGDGQPHFYAITMNAGTYTMYIDGTAVASDAQTVGGTGAAADWFDDLAGTGACGVGGAPGVSTSGGIQPGEFDELIYFDNVVLSASDISDLNATLNLTTSAGEGLVSALVAETTDGPQYLINGSCFSSQWVVDNGMGRTGSPTGVLVGTPIANPSHTGSETMIHGEIVSVSSASGEGWGSANLDTTNDIHQDTSGFIIWHGETDTDNAWNQTLFHFSDDSDATYTDPGSVWARVATDGTLRISISADDSTVNDYVFDYTTDGTYDIVDGTWHQVIFYQPADTNGIRLAINGTWFEYNDTNATQDSTGAHRDYWFNSSSATWGTSSPRCYVGCVYNGTGVNSYDGYHGTLVVDDDTLTSTQATRYWNAVQD